MWGSESTREDEKFDAAKAELFEAVGHPNRIKILQALDQGSVGFAELKKKVGIESSGHLSFHLGKLDQLVSLDSDGQYDLTGEGREALRMIHTVREGPRGERRWSPRLAGRSLAAILVVLLVALAMVAAVQQLELANLSAPPPGTVSLEGRPFWYSAIPLAAVPVGANMSVLIGGVEFTFIPGNLVTAVQHPNNGTATFVVSLSNITGAQVSRVISVRLVPSPDVLVRFPDGRTELVSTERTTTSNGVTTVSFIPQSWPWFSAHVNPQVAVSENSTEITLYVSAGR